MSRSKGPSPSHSASDPLVRNLGAIPDAGFERAMRAGPAHLRPVWWAAKHGRCALLIVGQGAAEQRLPPRSQPLITLLGDDTDRADGPDGFAREWLRKLVAGCAVGLVVSSEPMAHAYEAAAAAAVVHRRDVVIIETRPEQEIAWLDFILKAQPNIRLTVCTVAGGRA